MSAKLWSTKNLNKKVPPVYRTCGTDIFQHGFGDFGWHRVCSFDLEILFLLDHAAVGYYDDLAISNGMASQEGGRNAIFFEENRVAYSFGVLRFEIGRAHV